MRELSRRGLLGPEEGWSLAAVGAWLMIEGRHIADPIALLDALAARLNASGARIERLGFTIRTIHPQLLDKTARIQSLTKEAGVPLLLSEEFASHIKRPLRSLGRRDLRGVAGAHEVFTPVDGP